jgi:hypothetical protein
VVAHRRGEVPAREALPVLRPAELAHRIGGLEPPVPGLPERQPTALTGVDEVQLERRQHRIVVRQRGNSHRVPHHRSRSSGRNPLSVKIIRQTAKIICYRTSAQL